MQFRTNDYKVEQHNIHAFNSIQEKLNVEM